MKEYLPTCTTCNGYQYDTDVGVVAQKLYRVCSLLRGHFTVDADESDAMKLKAVLYHVQG